MHVSRSRRLLPSGSPSTDGHAMDGTNASENITAKAEKTTVKKRQPKRKAAADDVDGADGTNATSNSGVVAKRTRIKGKLSLMMTMPVDIFTEVGGQSSTANVVVCYANLFSSTFSSLS